MTRPKPRVWQQHPVTQLLAVFIGVVPVYAIVVWSALQSAGETEFQVPDLQYSLINLLIMVFGFGVFMLLILNFLCGERLIELDLKKQQSWMDLRDAILLVLALVAGQMLLGMVAPLFSITEIPEANRQIARELAGDNALLLIWLGPIVWLQAGVFEEFLRTFMLSRLWHVWPKAPGRYLVLAASSLLFGLGHLYQGPFGVLGTTLIGLILGYYYMTRGRVLPLIISHALYDTTVILLLVYATRINII